MNELTTTRPSQTIDSREIAQMGGINHWELLRKLEGSKDRKGYIQILNDNQMVVVDYFIKSEYLDEKGEKRPCYQFTKLGCEFIANKFTGEKGVLFTAKYVKRFNEMEQTLKHPKQQIISPEDKQKLAEARLKNAKAREANVLLKIANNPDLGKEYKQILFSYATSIIADKPLIPLPKTEELTLTAEEVGKRLGITANMVGRIAKAHNLKTEQYGKWFRDKSRYSSKEVESFRYLEAVIPAIEEIMLGLSNQEERM